ncbi:MAG: hypothetical protein QGG84_09880 [Rhodospirillales bacterium]|nr:hypothetical protein [Rhodospirillales bacterium]
MLLQSHVISDHCVDATISPKSTNSILGWFRDAEKAVSRITVYGLSCAAVAIWGNFFAEISRFI